VRRCGSLVPLARNRVPGSSCIATFSLLLCVTHVFLSQSDAQDPHKSLDWYKRTLGTQLPNDQVFAVLSHFYNDLDRAGVRHA
jgi:hypothetical protein